MPMLMLLLTILLSAIQPTAKDIHDNHDPNRAYRLGPRRRLGALHALKILHRVLLTGQDRPDLDVDAGSGESSRVEVHDAGIRGGAVAGELELEWQCAGGEWGG